MFDNNSAATNIQPWFIPFDILLIICAVLIVLMATIFIFIIIVDKACHTVAMMLITNTCFSVLMLGITRIMMTAFTLKNDLQQIQNQDSSCILLGYIVYVSYAIQNYSFFQQAFYRFMLVVYPTRLFWQSAKFQFFLICLTWIFGFVYSLPCILTGEIQYNIANQICQMPLRLSFLILYNTFIIYFIPMSAIIFVYFKLVWYVKQMSKRVTPVNTLLRAQRELKIVRRTMILVTGVVIIGFPYALFILISFFTSPPIYHFRIACIFVDVSLTFLMITLFKFTEPLKAFVMITINGRTNTILPTVA